MSSFVLFLASFVALISGLTLAANLLGLPPLLIGLIDAAFIGLGVLTVAARSRNAPLPAPEKSVAPPGNDA